MVRKRFMTFATEQEEFWVGKFGGAYADRNADNALFFSATGRHEGARP